MNLCPKDSVGLIARRVENGTLKFLMLERLKHPVGLACVAGHLEIFENNFKEEFRTAALREWQEETGSIIRNLKFLFQEQFPNPCSQYDGHLWEVYEVLEFEGQPKLTEPTKHGFVKWMSIAEIKDWISSDKPTDSAWFQFIFPKLAEIGDKEIKALLE
jgi:8-oxo-dGTP pyrophosphatase MutT (NUDIX family)